MSSKPIPKHKDLYSICSIWYEKGSSLTWGLQFLLLRQQRWPTNLEPIVKKLQRDRWIGTSSSLLDMRLCLLGVDIEDKAVIFIGRPNWIYAGIRITTIRWSVVVVRISPITHWLHNQTLSPKFRHTRVNFSSSRS